MRPRPPFPVPRLFLCLFCFLLPGPAAAADLADPFVGPALTGNEGRDYQVGHQGWNGLSDFAALLSELGCPAEARTVLPWDTLDGHDILLVLYPETALSEQSLLGFLSAGGRLVLADDFGQGDGALLALRIRRHTGPLPAGVALYRNSPALPIAVPQRQTPLGQATQALYGNHAAYFESALPATYAFAPDAALVIEGGVQRGRFVALADPSLFINNMMQLPGNRDFVVHLVHDLCRPHKDRFLLFHGPFSQRGTPSAVLLGAPDNDVAGDLPDRVNRALLGANLHIQETLGRREFPLGLDVVSLIGVVLTIGALLLHLRYLPLLAAPHDAGFAQVTRPPDSGLFSSLLRHARGDVPWGYLFPAALLREEVLLRLSPYLLALPRYGEPSRIRAAQVEKLVGEQRGQRAGKLAAGLWQEFRSIPGYSTVISGGQPIGILGGTWISQRRLFRLHRMATALFAELEVHAQ